MSMRLADPRPFRCSACMQSLPDIPHVDFDVAWDGPAIQSENGYPMNAIDDLILCTPCVRRAAELLAIDPQAMANLERENEALKRDLREAWNHIDTMEEAIPRRPGRPSKQKLGV